MEDFYTSLPHVDHPVPRLSHAIPFPDKRDREAFFT